MKKRILGLVLAAALVVSSFAACSSATKDESTDSKDESSTSSKEESKDESKEEPTALTGIDLLKSKDAPVEISMLYNTTETDLGKFEIFGWIEEASNVKLKPQGVPSSDYATKVETIYLAGTGADIISQNEAKLADVTAGVLLPMSDYEDQMPTYKAFLEESGARAAVDTIRFSDGKYYSFPLKMRSNVVNDKFWTMRTDVFAENNMEIPQTFDEMYEAGLKLKEIYPDSTPISNRFSAGNLMSGISAGFGTTAGWALGDTVMYDAESDSWSFQPSTDAWKEMLTFTNKMITDGVLDIEFSTLDSVTYEAKITQGQTFMMYDWYSNNAKYNGIGQTTDEDFYVEIVPNVQGPYGDYAIEGFKQYNQQCTVLAGAADDADHLAEILAYLDWLYTDEAEVLLTFGIEDETYVVNEDGSLAWKDPAFDYFNEMGLNSNNLPGRQHVDVLVPTTLKDSEKDVIKTAGVEGQFRAVPPTSPLTADQYEEAQVYLTGLVDYVNTSMEEFIFGKRSIDEFDAFVAECEEKGSSKIEAAYNEAWANK